MAWQRAEYGDALAKRDWVMILFHGAPKMSPHLFGLSRQAIWTTRDKESREDETGRARKFCQNIYNLHRYSTAAMNVHMWSNVTIALNGSNRDMKWRYITNEN